MRDALIKICGAVVFVVVADLVAPRGVDVPQWRPHFRPVKVFSM